MENPTFSFNNSADHLWKPPFLMAVVFRKKHMGSVHECCYKPHFSVDNPLHYSQATPTLCCPTARLRCALRSKGFKLLNFGFHPKEARDLHKTSWEQTAAIIRISLINDGWIYPTGYSNIFPKNHHFTRPREPWFSPGGLQQCEHLDEQTGSRSSCGAQRLGFRRMNHQHMGEHLRTCGFSN